MHATLKKLARTLSNLDLWVAEFAKSLYLHDGPLRNAEGAVSIGSLPLGLPSGKIQLARSSDAEGDRRGQQTCTGSELAKFSAFSEEELLDERHRWRDCATREF